MIQYEVPVAQTVSFEAANIIATSVMIDSPEKLDTWGSKIGNVDSKDANLFE